MLCFVLRNSVLLNLLCVLIQFYVLRTPSCVFDPHSERNIKMALIAIPLNAELLVSVTVVLSIVKPPGISVPANTSALNRSNQRTNELWPTVLAVTFGRS